jgi:hypothetical protein
MRPARTGRGLIAVTQAWLVLGCRVLGGTGLNFFQLKKPRALAFRLGFLCASAAGLAACAGTGGGIDSSSAFADPAKYAQYECKQLVPLRAAHTAKIEELRRLMAKAETGPGGGVMSELAYRPDLTRAQADLNSVNSSWERNRCGTNG